MNNNNNNPFPIQSFEEIQGVTCTLADCASQYNCVNIIPPSDDCVVCCNSANYGGSGCCVGPCSNINNICSYSFQNSTQKICNQQTGLCTFVSPAYY